MKLLHKIMLATDFSRSAEKAMETSIRLAKKFDSEILVLHVIPSMEISHLNKEMIEKGIRRELEKIHRKIRDEGIKLTDIGLQVGVPFIRIIQEADKHNVNVIVMGSSGQTSIQTGKLKAPGVTAEKVLHKATKPVWIVHEPSREIKKILCPVDFSKPARRALKNAIHLARKFDAHLSVLHAVPSMLDFYLNMIGNKEGRQDEKIQKHGEQLDKFLSDFDFHGVRYDKIVKPGRVHQLILEQAKTMQPDLMIMGTSGESTNPKILMGSNTEYVVRELPASLVTVKSESVIQPMIDYQISDLESRYQLGREYLKNGFPEEAMEHFRYCIEQNVLFAQAWEGMAQCHERLGYEESAREYREKARKIKEQLWTRNVETEIRNRHNLVGQ